MPVRSRLIAGLAAIALAFGAGWLVNGWRHDAKLARLQSQHSTVLEQLAHATVASVEAVRSEEARRHAAVEEQRDIAQQQAQALEVDVSTAISTANRLWIELDALRGRECACRADTPDRSPSEPGVDAIGLLIDMLIGVESAGREVAEYADRLRIAGLACERAFDEIRE